MKTTKTKKAIVAPVTIAGNEFIGVMFPDGSYGITVSQASTILGIAASSKTASRGLKRLHSNGYSASREYIDGESSTQGVVSLQWFSEAITTAAFKGNEIAQAFVRACTGTTLEMYLDLAFGMEKSLKERVTWTEVRAAGIISRTKATDALRDCLIAKGIEPQAHHYINLTEALNKAVLGFTAREFKEVNNLPVKTNLRDLLNQDQLKSLDFAEELYAKRLIKTQDPRIALSQTIEIL